MAVLKIKGNLNVEKIFVQVTCPVCDGTVHMKMRGPETRKSCPKCNRVTYYFNVAPMRGYVGIVVFTIGPDETPTDYILLTSDVEIELDESTDRDEPEEHDRDAEPEY